MKVFLICGKICSGKSYYAKKLKDKYNAVILSTDEVTFDLINNEQGEFYNIFAERVNLHLRKKAVEICKAGANVILDWGFWTREVPKFVRLTLLITVAFIFVNLCWLINGSTKKKATLLKVLV